MYSRLASRTKPSSREVALYTSSVVIQALYRPCKLSVERSRHATILRGHVCGPRGPQPGAVDDVGRARAHGSVKRKKRGRERLSLIINGCPIHLGRNGQHFPGCDTRGCQCIIHKIAMVSVVRNSIR